MRTRLAVASAMIVAAIIGASAGATGARFTDGGGVNSNSFSSATLQPPTGLGAAAACVGLGNAKITLTWTATTSTFADGYDVYRGTASGGPYSNIAHVTGRTTVSYVNTGLTTNKTYYYVLQSTAYGWTSANSGQASATTPLICL